MTISKYVRKIILSRCSGAAALLVEGAALVFALAPLAWVVPVNLLIAHMPERGSKPGRAGSGGPVAQPAVPVEADVHEGRLLLGGRFRERVPKTAHLAPCDEGLLVPPAGRVLLRDVVAELRQYLRLLVQCPDVFTMSSRQYLELMRKPSSATMLKFHGMTIIMADLMALSASWNSERSVKSSPSASMSPLVLDEDCLVGVGVCCPLRRRPRT
jgi:hypothetical protein